jgi:TRAP-type C4-dicarboxylate transport system permease small subunit
MGEEPPLLEYGPLDRWYKVFTRWMSYLAGAALFVITVVCFVDVIGWKFFGWTFPSQVGLVANLNVVVVFLAAAYVQMDRGSVSIELLQNRFNRVVKLVTRMFASVLGVGVCWFAAYRGWSYFAELYHTHATDNGAWHFKTWPFEAVLVLGWSLMGLAFVFTIVREVVDYRRRRSAYAPKTPDPSQSVTPTP